MNNRQIGMLRRRFKRIRELVVTKKDYDYQLAKEEMSWINGYLFALWQEEIVTDKQYDTIHNIASNLVFHGSAKTNKVA
jgi:hypothetical protein